MASTSMTYSILAGSKDTAGSLKWYVNHTEIYPAAILDEAQQLVYRKLRVREMLTHADVSAASGDSTISLDTLAPRFIQPSTLKLDGYGKITYLREENFPDDRNEDGDLEVGPVPSCWTVRGTTLHFDIQLNAAVAGDFWYYAALAPLASSSNETNVLTDKFPELFRHALLSRAYAHRNRADMMQSEFLLFNNAVAEANAANDDFRFGQEI